MRRRKIRKFAYRQSNKQTENSSKTEATLILCGSSGERANLSDKVWGKSQETSRLELWTKVTAQSHQSVLIEVLAGECPPHSYWWPGLPVLVRLMDVTVGSVWKKRKDYWNLSWFVFMWKYNDTSWKIKHSVTGAAGEGCMYLLENYRKFCWHLIMMLKCVK